MKIQIYESALCCSTGVCGPEPDKQLIELQNLINLLTPKGIEVYRYAINQQPMEFAKNELIKNLIKSNGLGVLPVTLVDGVIFKTVAYAQIEDIKKIIPELDINILDEIIIQ